MHIIATTALAGGLAVLTLVPQIPRPQIHRNVSRGHTIDACELVAKPGNAFTAIRARRSALRAGAPATLAPATVDVQYVGFDSAPAARAAVQYAVEIWRAALARPVPIRLRAALPPLESGGNTRCGAGLRRAIADTWYPDALPIGSPRSIRERRRDAVATFTALSAVAHDAATPPASTTSLRWPCTSWRTASVSAYGER